MICPYCSYDNIQGVDTCSECLMDLRILDEPKGETPIEDALIRERVTGLDPKKAIMVSPETSIADAIATLVDKNIGCVLVGEEGRVVGIFSERDVLLRVSHRMEEVGERPVSEFMTTDVSMLDEGTRLAFALKEMSSGDFRHLPLTRDERLSGIVSLRDFLGLVFRWYPDLGSPAA